MSATAAVADALARQAGGTASAAFGLDCVEVSAQRWLTALQAARDQHRLGYFDWLGGVDEAPEGFAVVIHLAELSSCRHLLLRTRVPRSAPVLSSAVGLFAGAAWHERETAEMYGVVFEGHPQPTPLLLGEDFDGHPLRKDFVLASRVATPWPGTAEPGGGTARQGRRPPRPPGVPDAGEWGPTSAPGTGR
ncbi:MAG: NADH-quinone oxidoreductase subunit C [Geodermatophilaceae bacterium]